MARWLVFLYLGVALLLPQTSAYAFERGEVKARIKESREDRSGKGNNADGVSHVKLAGLDVAVWQAATQTSRPLIVFSHGFDGCNTQSAFLMRSLAASGYIVMAPNHADSKCGKASSGRPEERFGNASAWTDTNRSR